MSEQADRLEEKMERLIALLEQNLAQSPVLSYSVEKLQPLDPSVLPDWYRDLYSLPNFKKSFVECQQWLSEKIIIETKADETAAYIRSVWPGKGPRPWKDPWATFRTNVVRRFGGKGGVTREHLQTDPEEQAQAERTRADRLADRRAEMPNVPGDNLGQS